MVVTRGDNADHAVLRRHLIPKNLLLACGAWVLVAWCIGAAAGGLSRGFVVPIAMGFLLIAFAAVSLIVALVTTGWALFALHTRWSAMLLVWAVCVSVLLVPVYSWAQQVEFEYNREIRERVARDALKQASSFGNGEFEILVPSMTSEFRRYLIASGGSVKVVNRGEHREVLFRLDQGVGSYTGLVLVSDASPPDGYDQWEHVSGSWYRVTYE